MPLIHKISVAVFILLMKVRKTILCLDPRVSIGVATYGIPKIYFQGKQRLTIGSYCSISSRVVIFLGGEHRSDFVSTFPFNQFSFLHRCLNGHPVSRGDVVIGNDVWIGYGALILSGVTVGDGAIIGANAVVAKSIPPYAIVVGNPARVIRYRFSPENVEKLTTIKWWQWNPLVVEKNISKLFSSDIETFIRNADDMQTKSTVHGGD